MTVIEILKRSDYHYRPTEAEWEEIWDPVREDQELMENNFVRSLYQQWLRKSEGKWADTHPRLSQAQMRCLVQTVYGKRPPRPQE